MPLHIEEPHVALSSSRRKRKCQCRVHHEVTSWDKREVMSHNYRFLEWREVTAHTVTETSRVSAPQATSEIFYHSYTTPQRPQQKNTTYHKQVETATEQPFLSLENRQECDMAPSRGKEFTFFVIALGEIAMPHA